MGTSLGPKYNSIYLHGPFGWLTGSAGRAFRGPLCKVLTYRLLQGIEEGLVVTPIWRVIKLAGRFGVSLYFHAPW